MQLTNLHNVDAFIINLSNIFDFDISMPVLSSLIAEKRVWISRNGGAFPVHPNEALVSTRLFEFYNKYEHLRVTLNVSRPLQKKPELIVILGYEEWGFLNYGKLSAYPYFKMQYILSKLSEFFAKPQHQLPFKIRFILTQQAGAERHLFFDSLEVKGFLNSENKYWFSEDLLACERYVDSEKFNELMKGKRANDVIDEKIKRQLDLLYETIAGQLEKFGDKLEVPELIVESWKQSFKITLENIKIIQHLVEAVANEFALLRSFFYNTLSLVAKLPQLAPVYKYTIDTSTTYEGLRTKFELALFVFQFIIDPIVEEKNKLYKVLNVEVNTQALKPILEKLQGTILRYKKKPVDSNKEETYNVYSVNDSYYKNLPQIENKDKNEFCNIFFLKRIAGLFYQRDKKEQLRAAYQKNSYKLLENKIPMDIGFSSLLKDALNKQTQTITARMIPTEIHRFEQLRPTSPINLQQYTEKRDELLAKQDDAFEKVIEVLNVRPHMANFAIGILAVILFVSLFSLPVFSWVYWDNAVMWIPILTIGIIGDAFYVLFRVNRLLVKYLKELEQVRIALSANLIQHCDNIKAAAKQMAEAYAKRETLRELKGIWRHYEEQSYRVLAYESYHYVNEESIKSLSTIYDIPVTPVDVTLINSSFDKHPEDDFNLIYEFPVNDIELVINQQTTSKNNIHTLIKKAEIAST